MNNFKLSYYVDYYLFSKKKNELEDIVYNYPYIIELINKKYNKNFKEIKVLYYYKERNKYYAKDLLKNYSFQYILLYFGFLIKKKRNIIKINNNIFLYNKFLIFNSFFINELFLIKKKYEINQLVQFIEENINLDKKWLKEKIIKYNKLLENNQFNKIFNKNVDLSPIVPESKKLDEKKIELLEIENKNWSIFNIFKSKININEKLKSSLNNRNLELEILI